MSTNRKFLQRPALGDLVWSVTATFTVAALILFLLCHIAKAAEVGTWVREDGSVVQVPCTPAERQADLTLTVRLAAGCPITTPRIGYSLAQDLKLRAELPALREQVALLKQEVVDSRAAADKIASDLQRLLADAHADADEQVKQRQALEADLALERGKSEALSSDWWKYGLVGIAVGAAASGAIYILTPH